MDKVKELWAKLVASVGLDWAIAVVAIIVLLLIEPVLAILAAGAFVAYKKGLLNKLVETIKSRFTKT